LLIPTAFSVAHGKGRAPRPFSGRILDERVKIHDVVIEGIDAVLKRRGYPSIESLKAGKKR
jgi:hypothetical protein